MFFHIIKNYLLNKLKYIINNKNNKIILYLYKKIK